MNAERIHDRLVETARRTDFQVSQGESIGDAMEVWESRSLELEHIDDERRRGGETPERRKPGLVVVLRYSRRRVEMAYFSEVEDFNAGSLSKFSLADDVREFRIDDERKVQSAMRQLRNELLFAGLHVSTGMKYC